MQALSRQKQFSIRILQSVMISAVVLCSAILPRTEAHAADLIVYYDQSQLLRLPRPVAEVIIGNPSIADVSIQGGNLLVVTGKTFGITNIIALDAERNIIQDQRVVVERDQQRIVNVHRGAARNSFSCTPDCSSTLTIGDDVKYFQMITTQAKNKTGFSSSSSSQASGQNGGQ